MDLITLAQDYYFKNPGNKEYRDEYIRCIEIYHEKGVITHITRQVLLEALENEL